MEKDNRKLYNQSYYQENLEKLKEKHRQYAKQNYLKTKEKRNTIGYTTRNKLIRKELKDKVFLLLGNKCCKCGFSDSRALQIDHIYGRGNEENKKWGGSSTYFKHIIEINGDGYQILCANCNWIKRYENCEYPVYKHSYIN
jgi:hypothetical protein